MGTGMRRDFILHALQSPGWMLTVAAAVGLSLVLIALLLRDERRLVSRPVGYTLLGLRSLVILVSLFCLLEPVLTWTSHMERRGRIVVAVDVSESMETTDSHAGRAEKLRWARSLGMIGNAAVDERLDRWLEAFQAGREPEWVDDSERVDQARRKQLATVRRNNLEDLFAGLDEISRKEIAYRLLTAGDRGLLSQLETLADIELHVFGGRAEQVDSANLETAILEPPERAVPGKSNLTQALRTTSAQADSASAPLLGIVLLTDGRDNSEADPVKAAASLGAASIPVVPVLIGSEHQPRDLAIGALDYSRKVFTDDRLLIGATLHTAGFENDEISVVLEAGGAEVERQTVRPGGPTAQVEFAWAAQDVGRQEFVIRTEVQPGETSDENNRKTFAVNVIDGRARVVLLEGEARWEFRFLDNALTRDPRVDVQRVVFEQPYLELLPETFFPRELSLPDDPGDLANSPFADADLVVVGDVSPADMPEAAWQTVETFVSEAGGTVVMTAGRNHFPREFDSPALKRLLPVSELRGFQTSEGTDVPPHERGTQLRLTPDGANETMFQFSADRHENESIWNSLPGHPWVLFGEPKPAATVFAYSPQVGHEPQTDRIRKNALIVHQYYGAGQVLWIGTDSTWRWRHRVGDKYHHHFWGQLVRWAAENKAAAAHEFVAFGPDETDVTVGDEVLLHARWTQPFFKRYPQLEAEVHVFREGQAAAEQPVAVVELTPQADLALNHEGRALGLAAGAYRLELKVQRADLGPDPITAPLYVHPEPSIELSDLSANRELLAQLADVSQGRLVRPDEIDQIPELFRPPEQSMIIHDEVELWDHWLIAVVIVGLMTAEWAVRKWNGLP